MSAFLLVDWPHLADDLLRFLLATLFILGAYHGARSWTVAHPAEARWWVALKTLGMCACVALMAGSTLGTHTEDEGNYRVSVVDFVPTEAERLEHGLFIFGLLGVPAVLGAWWADRQTPPAPDA
jgi:hypothetical protein